MQISSKQCPVLLRSSLHELFPAPEVYNKGTLTLITLSHKSGTQVENGAKNVSIYINVTKLSLIERAVNKLFRISVHVRISLYL